MGVIMESYLSEYDNDYAQSDKSSPNTSPTPQQVSAQMQQLEILDDSMKYTTFIIVGLFLTLEVLKIQRCQLLNPTARRCDVYPIRVTSNIIILIALTFFLRLSQTLVCTETTSCQQKKSNQINNISSTLVWIASSLRLLDLLCNRADTEVDL